MKRQALFFCTFTAAMLALPAFGAGGPSSMMETRWGKNAFNFEGMPSGPQPLRNLSRLPNGKANAGRLVGDYHNPILTPEAAAVVPSPMGSSVGHWEGDMLVIDTVGIRTAAFPSVTRFGTPQ